jgi:hypothetical protein
MVDWVSYYCYYLYKYPTSSEVGDFLFPPEHYAVVFLCPESPEWSLPTTLNLPSIPNSPSLPLQYKSAAMCPLVKE